MDALMSPTVPDPCAIAPFNPEDGIGPYAPAPDWVHQKEDAPTPSLKISVPLPSQKTVHKTPSKKIFYLMIILSTFSLILGIASIVVPALFNAKIIHLKIFSKISQLPDIILLIGLAISMISLILIGIFLSCIVS